MATLFEHDPPEESGAIISECGLYRYHLWRIWDTSLPTLVWVMQNPSTADATHNDSTIKKCITLAKVNGFGSISVRNVFALRATDETELLKYPDPFGPENFAHLQAARQVSLLTRLMLAWGNRLGGKKLASHYKLAESILLAQSPYCIAQNKDGSPVHPLFQKKDSKLIKFGPAKESAS